MRAWVHNYLYRTRSANISGRRIYGFDAGQGSMGYRLPGLDEDGADVDLIVDGNVWRMPHALARP